MISLVLLDVILPSLLGENGTINSVIIGLTHCYAKSIVLRFLADSE
jgi:hypothetical protein